jgi:hypothetical protein
MVIFQSQCRAMCNVMEFGRCIVGLLAGFGSNPIVK